MKLHDRQPSSLLRDRLRCATQKAHEVLEGSLDLLHQPPEREYFVRLLVRFHGFHRIWDSAVARQLPDTVLPRPRVVLIEHDLRALGLNENAIRTICTLAPCAAATRLGDHPDTALGSAYVLEGSTLGGRVITEHLSEASWCPPGGLQYFNPYGDKTGSNWQAMLRHIAVAPGDTDRIVAGALCTFEILQEWLVSGSSQVPADCTENRR